MCQAVIVLIFGLKFCKGETQELLVAANMFSCSAPSCDQRYCDLGGRGLMLK